MELHLQQTFVLLIDCTGSGMVPVDGTSLCSGSQEDILVSGSRYVP